MKLKKINAVISLLSVLALLLHVGYVFYAYLTFDYNASIQKVFSRIVEVLVCIHAVLGMSMLFLMGDGTRLRDYPRQNLATVLQRVSAALLFPLLLVHVKTFKLLQGFGAEGSMVKFTVVQVLQAVFYADVAVHVVISLPRAFITLGLLRRERTRKVLERVLWVLGALAFAALTITVARTQRVMLLH